MPYENDLDLSPIAFSLALVDDGSFVDCVFCSVIPTDDDLAWARV